MKNVKKAASGLIYAILVGLCVAGIWKLGSSLLLENKRIEEAEAKHVNDPVALYKTVGIKDCGYDTRNKGERSGAALLAGEDLGRALFFLKSGPLSSTAIEGVLYVNSPEANGPNPGQPALLAFSREDGKPCSLGIVGSHSTPLFLEFKTKYQEFLRLP